MGNHSLDSTERMFQGTVAMLLEQSGVDCETEKMLEGTNRAMDIFVWMTDSAIELKVDSNQRKGVGQALDYKLDMEEAVLLVPYDRYDERVHQICLDAGVTYALLHPDGFEFSIYVSDRLEFLERVDPTNLCFRYRKLRKNGETISWGNQEALDKTSNVNGIIRDLEKEGAGEVAQIDEVRMQAADDLDLDADKVDFAISTLKNKGEVYELPDDDGRLRST